VAAAPARHSIIIDCDPGTDDAIALWLAWGAFKASSQAIDQLMDKEWPEEKRQRFAATLDRELTRLLKPR